MIEPETILLPCPFCGAAASLKTDGYLPHSEAPVYWIECPDCAVMMGGEETGAEAVAAWNRRAPSAALARVTAERDRLIETYPESMTYGVYIEDDGKWAVVAGEGYYPFDTKAEAVRFRVGLDPEGGADG